DARFEEFKQDSEARRQELGTDQFYVNPRAPMTGMHTNRLEQREARMAEMDARMEEFKKASDARRLEADAAYKARLQERTSKVEADQGV
ncbi:MAG: hypothetical protein QNL87_04305, partial [Gammaproteobacteria bacterium]|nr:hypothetical protein [Gammaproteobacteria bacterium]